MRRFYAALSLTLCAAGCRTLGQAETDPALFMNGRTMNSAIINFTPPRYGLGQPGGCTVEGEFRVVLTQLERGAGDTLRLGGTVGSADPARGHHLAVLVRVLRRGIQDSRTLAVPGDGGFEIVAEAGDSAVMTFSMLGFRTLEVDLDQLARVAERTGPAPTR